MSGEFTIKDQPMDGNDAFTLPPAAMSPAKAEFVSRRSSRSDPSFAPASPTSPELAARGRTAQSSRSGTATKRPLEDFDLPPPPTRTRKIIQMKPKAPAASKSPAKPKENTKAAAQTSPEATATATSSKKKQPSATSAAGRKIARKTAHSLIERRRRSKMNEEFGTLKDMIPACRGQEMHKLAILQVCLQVPGTQTMSQSNNRSRQALTTSTIWSDASQTSKQPAQTVPHHLLPPPQSSSPKEAQKPSSLLNALRHPHTPTQRQPHRRSCHQMPKSATPLRPSHHGPASHPHTPCRMSPLSSQVLLWAQRIQLWRKRRNCRGSTTRPRRLCSC